ncbi:DNA-binding transcriptional regulator, MarR family [Natronincola peptidivorans]|uniref:DNA-binding transcriptional regulator, MarR family n=1 Tax=Natronincola peptidivorans TaxID=426128 RepID=A0A1I0CIR4_9FIRM|nr:MarR family transcriptional regulator [Natronincola peptidivorans]SET19306.1 DNA-binding transcriptional regulator, MarR family [Natronincola peptidivorans]
MRKIRQGGYLISKIHQLAGRIFAKKLKEYNITEINPAQGRILFALWQNDNISIQELSKQTALGKSTLTRMLDRLEESGHLLRIYSSTDRRKVLVQLTEENKKMKTAYEKVSLDMTELFYKNFKTVEIEEFEAFLERIFNNLLDSEKN